MEREAEAEEREREPAREEVDGEVLLGWLASLTRLLRSEIRSERDMI
jgi:hypothetical protein